jgi:N4-gp56 family major capsid protein
MADFTTGIMKVGDVDDSIVLEFSTLVTLLSTPELVATQVANIDGELNGKSMQFSKYSNLAVPSALSDGVDPDSVTLVDSAVTLTPAEEGLVVTKTALGSFQTGGKVDVAAAQLVARNAGQTLDYRAITALDAFGGTTIYPNGATAVGNLTTADVLDKTFAGRLYNKLARANTPGLVGGTYFGIAHDDCLHDLREDTANGAWTDVSKYTDLASVLTGEIGMYKGIRWLRSGNATVTSNVNGTIDGYTINVVGFNALGMAKRASQAGMFEVRITGPFDKLARFINVGWYSLIVFDTIDANNQIQGKCASSVGAN